MSRTLELVRGAVPEAANDEPAKPPVVAIAVPSHDHVHTAFAMSLAQMLYRLGVKRPVRTALINNRGSLVHINRNNGVAKAKELGAVKLLFIDSDLSFPMDALERLLAHDKLIVGATYAQRSGLHKNLAKSMGEERQNVHGLTEVSALPGGMMMIDMTVFDSLRRPYFRQDFIEEDVEAGIEPRTFGEDYNFCERARAAGHSIWMDVELSFDLIHWGEAGWRLDDALCGRDPEQPDARMVEMATA